MAILDGSPRSASVRASVATTAFRFPRDKFAPLLADDNLSAYKLVHQMARVLCARQRSTTTQLAELLARGSDLEQGVRALIDRSALVE
jgi:CRP-like cAMP-binding protein